MVYLTISKAKVKKTSVVQKNVEDYFGRSLSQTLWGCVRKTQFNTIQTLTTLFSCFMGENIIDFIAKRDALWGRKSKAGGREKIKKRLSFIHPCLIVCVGVLVRGRSGWVGIMVRLGVGYTCPTVRNNIVIPRHLLRLWHVQDDFCVSILST